MAWNGQANNKEMKSVLSAIQLLEQKPFIHHMSYATIAKTTCCLKETAVRWIVPELEKRHLITKLTIGEQKVPRYFYKITDAGKKYLEEEDN